MKYNLSPFLFQYAQILRERLRESFHDVQYVEPPFDDSIADIGKEWKSALAKLKFANSYRMEPLRKFQAHSVETKIQQILKVIRAQGYSSVVDSYLAHMRLLRPCLVKIRHVISIEEGVCVFPTETPCKNIEAKWSYNSEC